jgi:GT2 family glycosyltransferase
MAEKAWGSASPRQDIANPRIGMRFSQRMEQGSKAGVVVIGRNEGARLQRCLESLRTVADRTVYVDSGSSDGSVALSRAAGIVVVELDSSAPFTAARARNEGFRRLLDLRPALGYVFFVDGDCEVVDGWLDTATQFLDGHPKVGVVCGYRRERYPEKTIYNMLCDCEWRSPPCGDTQACGGDAVIRISAFEQVHGFRPEVIAGEEPELCIRLLEAGWKIWRLGETMTLHDAAMDRFGQWWRRALRSGYGCAQLVHLHGAPPERHFVAAARSAWIWGLCIPLAIGLLSIWTRWWALGLLIVYPLQIVRIARRGRFSAYENWVRAASFVVIKFPEMLGQIKYAFDQFRHVQRGLIEYKRR